MKPGLESDFYLLIDGSGDRRLAAAVTRLVEVAVERAQSPSEAKLIEQIRFIEEHGTSTQKTGLRAFLGLLHGRVKAMTDKQEISTPSAPRRRTGKAS